MKNIIFDLDGTLIDSRADLALAVNLTRQDFELPPKPQAEIMACVGDGVRALIQRAIPELPHALEELLARQKTHYLAHCLDETVLYPGVRKTLCKLKSSGWRMAVVTNKPALFTIPILDGLEVLPFFQAVVGGDQAAALKPDPAPLTLAAQRMGVALDASDWIVGDNHTDLEAGRRAGIRRCFCTYGIGHSGGKPYETAVDDFPALLDITSRPG